MLSKRLSLLCLFVASSESRAPDEASKKNGHSLLKKKDHLKDFRTSSLVSPSTVPATDPSDSPTTTIPSALPSRTPGRPTTAPVTEEFENCFTDLVTADVDGSGAIEWEEYLGFINIYGQRFCWQQDELAIGQIANFNRLACRCREETGDATCCLSGNARLPLTNALDARERTREQFEFFAIVCQSTEATISDLCD